MLLCALLLFGSFFVVPAYAAEATISTVVGGASYFQTFNSAGFWVNLGTPEHYLEYFGDVAYCVETELGEPQNASYYAIDGESLYSTPAVRKGIQIILENGYPSTNGGFSDDEARYATANAIRFFLADCGEPHVPQWMNLNLYGQFFRAKSGYEDLMYWCLELRDMANAQSGAVSSGPGSGTVSFSSKSVDLSESGDAFAGTLRVTHSGCAGGYALDCSGLPDDAVINGYTGNSGDTLSIYLPKSYAGESYTLKANGLNYSSRGSVTYYAPYNSSLQHLVAYEPSYSDDFMTVDTDSATLVAPAAATASLRLQKTDSETREPLEGALYAVYDESYELVTSGYTDEKGVLQFYLPLGKYYYREEEAPEGHVLNNRYYPCELTYGGQLISVALQNSPIKPGSIEIKKLDADTKQPLQGVKIGLYDSSGKLLKSEVTNASGVVLFSNVEAGNYKYAEIEALPGYILDTVKYSVSLGIGTKYTATMYNTAVTCSVSITKLDANTKQPLQGVSITLYDSNGTQLKSIQTNDSGIARFTGLAPGTYKYAETAALPGYVLDSTKHSIIISQDDLDPTATLYNDPVTGSVSITKVDAAGNALAGAEFKLYKLSAAGEPELIATTETDASGRLSFTELDASGQVYRIVESKAPKGHSLQAACVFDGTLDELGTELELTVCDSANITMPFTGSEGFTYMFAPMYFMGFFAAHVMKRRKNHEN